MLTDSTCGPACWYAREDACRCSCGSTNHGILLSDGAAQPRRNCKIAGVRYVLGRAGRSTTADRYDWAIDITREIEVRKFSLLASNDRNSPVWVKLATPQQVANWPELSEFNQPGSGHRRPYLVWVREDLADRYDAWLAEREQTGVQA